MRQEGIGLIPKVEPKALAKDRPSEYIVRFLFGASISLVAGLIGMKFGPVVGGVFLGFPAILPASLTLIAKKEGKEEASIDSLGAVLGAVAMVAFAIVIVLGAPLWGVVSTLIVALVVWNVVAFALYAIVAVVYKREPAPP